MNIYTDKSGESIINKLTGGFVTVKKGDTVLLVGYTGEERDVVIPSSVHEINQYVFYHSDIDSVRIGGATKKINSYAFAQSSLKSVVINGIADLTIGEYAFAFCEQLETTTFAFT